jgi:hypothetical protein
LTINIDSREHANELKRIQKQFDEIGIKYFRSKLYVGDYMSLDNARLVVDRKKDLQELCGNVCQQHERFKRELLRAAEAGIQIVFLVEHGPDVVELEDVYFWQNPRKHEIRWRVNRQTGQKEKYFISPKAVDGKQLYKSLCTIRDRYGAQFRFCTKDQTGRKIMEILSNGKAEGI